MIEIVFIWDLYQATVKGEFFRLDHLSAPTEAACKANADLVRKDVKAAFGRTYGKPYEPVVYCAKRPVRTAPKG